MLSKPMLVEVEPSQTRTINRNHPPGRLRRAELSDIAASEMLVLGACIAESVVRSLDLRERMKIRRLVIMIVSGMCVAIGLTQLAIYQLFHN